MCNLTSVCGWCAAGVDYTDPSSLLGGGVVHFHPAVGSISSALTIPILPDNIAEGTEYFGLSFVQIISDEDNPIVITPVDPIEAIVTINDTNGEYTKTSHVRIYVCRCFNLFCNH